jgi:transcription initiation factor TFIIIB Brf1 subunit/transcription initiation factor TFIIB
MTFPSEEGQSRPRPCPECESTRGYSRVGNFRVQCLGCNALLKNEEVDMQLPDEETR